MQQVQLLAHKNIVGGDTLVEIGNVVEEFMLGQTKVRICDDYYKDKSPEDIQEILDKVAQDVLNCYKEETA